MFAKNTLTPPLFIGSVQLVPFVLTAVGYRIHLHHPFLLFIYFCLFFYLVTMKQTYLICFCNICIKTFLANQVDKNLVTIVQFNLKIGNFDQD